MKAYIIGKPEGLRNPDLPAQLSKWFEVVKTDGYVAVEPERMLAPVDQNLFLAVHRRPPTVGEVGCALAHLGAWKFLAESNLPHLAVFEDDTKLLVADMAPIIESTASLRGPWYLTLQQISTDRWLWQAFLKWPRIRRVWIQPRGTVGYIISREAAELGVSDFEANGGRIQGTSDRWPGPAGCFKYYQALPPAIGASDGGVSYIGQRQADLEPLASRLTRFFSILAYSDAPMHTKRGLVLLKVGRTARFLFSVHFATAWYSVRWGAKASTTNLDFGHGRQRGRRRD